MGSQFLDPGLGFRPGSGSDHRVVKEFTDKDGVVIRMIEAAQRSVEEGRIIKL